METYLDTDAVTLSCLQISLLQKMRRGSITGDHMKWFLELTQSQRDTLISGGKQKSTTVPSSKPKEKFVLLADLDIITVPDDYEHVTWLATFKERHHRKFVAYNDDLIDMHFPEPSRILKPGDKVCVRIFRQTCMRAKSEERMAFLKAQHAVYTGVQGASLVFDQKYEQLPKGIRCISYDEKNHLWKDERDHFRVPSIRTLTGGGYYFDLPRLSDILNGGSFFCFRETSCLSLRS